jgi:hypothetical protein
MNKSVALAHTAESIRDKRRPANRTNIQARHTNKQGDQGSMSFRNTQIMSPSLKQG